MCLTWIWVSSSKALTSHFLGFRTEMALFPPLCFKLDTHDHSWLHSAAILTQLKHIPKEHLIFMLHLHACMDSIGPSQRQFFMVWVWAVYETVKGMVACHYQFKLLAFHISILRTRVTLSLFCFLFFFFLICWCMYVCLCAHATVCVWKPEGSL